MNSLQVYEFKKSIQSFVSKSPIPDEVKRMVLAEILREQEQITLETLKREIEERDREESENGNAESLQ